LLDGGALHTRYVCSICNVSISPTKLEDGNKPNRGRGAIVVIILLTITMATTPLKVENALLKTFFNTPRKRGNHRNTHPDGS
jgi:hypothetical protein